MMKTTTLSAAMLIFFTSILTGQSDIKAALRCIELRDFNQAISIFEDLSAKDPYDLTLLHKLGQCYNSTQQLEKARLTYTNMLSQQASYTPEMILEYADILKSLAEFSEAKVYYLKYAESNPDLGNYYAKSCDFAMANLSKPLNCEIQNLPINSSDSEFAPNLYKDLLVFASTNNKDITIKSGNTNLYKVKALNPTGRTDVSSVFAGIITPTTCNGSVSYAPNGEYVAFTRSADGNSSNQLQHLSPMSIYIAKTTEEGAWAEEIAFPYNDANYSLAFPHWSADNTTLYFSANLEGGQGGYDLYKSTLIEGNWSSPENLGSEINTRGNEIAAYTVADKLYFSSDFHTGFGGYDIFNAFKKDNQTIIENLGPCINSTRDDYNFILANNGDGYFTSNRPGGKGFEDIYAISKAKLNGEVNSETERETEAEIETKAEREAESETTVASTPTSIQAEQITMTPKSAEQLVEVKELKNKSVQTPTKLYFIQIAALVQYNAAAVQKFAKFTRFGNVYACKIDGITKIRIGGFAKLNDAVATLDQMKKSGLKDAFIVTDVMDERSTLVAKASTDFENTTSTSAPSTTNNTTPTAPVKEEGKYKIRVAEYKSPDWFDTSKINDLGSVEHWTKSGWTIIILGSFPTEAKAKTVLSQLKQRGYPESYIVVEEDGRLYRL